jgi:hypothetical protein
VSGAIHKSLQCDNSRRFKGFSASLRGCDAVIVPFSANFRSSNRPFSDKKIRNFFYWYAEAVRQFFKLHKINGFVVFSKMPRCEQRRPFENEIRFSFINSTQFSQDLSKVGIEIIFLKKWDHDL